MQRLLIVGCGDTVRRALPRLLRHWRVYALVRTRDAELAAQGVTQILGDLDRPHTLHRLAGLADAVLHSAPPPDHGDDDPRTRRLLAALVRRGSLPSALIYISTSGVYGDCGGARVAETRAARPSTARARRRVSAECQLRAFGRRSGCRVSLLRAPGIYAADRMPLERLRRGLPLFRREDDGYSNHIHAEDLARACERALRCGAANRAYNICDDQPLLMGDWYDRLADAYGMARLPRLPRVEAEAQLPAMQLSFMNESRQLENRRMHIELGLRLAYPTVDAGIADALRNH